MLQWRRAGEGVRGMPFPVGDWASAAIAAGVKEHFLVLLAWVKLIAETLLPVIGVVAGVLFSLACLKYLVEQ